MSYLLQLSTLAAGRTEDDVAHIENCITDVICAYSSYHGLTFTCTKSVILDHLKKHKPTQSLLLDIKLLELNIWKGLLCYYFIYCMNKMNRKGDLACRF